MHMLYNSDNFAVVQFDMQHEAGAPADRDLGRDGYEIVDKHARREIYLDGFLAARFKQDVEDLIRSEPSEDEVDEFLERFSGMAQQPVVLH